MSDIFALEKLLEGFAEPAAPVAQLVAAEKATPVVVFAFDRAAEYAAKPLLTPLLFLFRGRSDLVRRLRGRLLSYVRVGAGLDSFVCVGAAASR